jgi:CubicO group peptidase (beta-lactamase class C family)
MSTRTKTLLSFILVPVGLLLLGVPALWVYMKTTAKPLHPNPQEVPSISQSAPIPHWVTAVEQGRQIVRATLSEKNLPGLSVAVGIGGNVVWAEGFGFADLDARVPVTPNHRFRIGTTSVALTSAAAGLLVEQGRLKLDDPIQTYVPSFPQKQWPVTLRDLMADVAGLPFDGGDESPLFGQHCEKPVEALPLVADKPLQFEPGTRFQFSVYGWILVSAAIEAASGMPFLDFMRDRVFDPLAMRDTLADSTTKAVPNRASVYFPRFAADPKYGPDPMRGIELSCYSGSSVLLSTPSDLARFGMAIMGGKLLRPATVQLLQAPQRLHSGAETGNGLGWELATVPLAGAPAREAGHNGDLMGGMTTSLLTFPERGMVVAVSSNISYAGTDSLATRIAQAFGH